MGSTALAISIASVVQNEADRPCLGSSPVCLSVTTDPVCGCIPGCGSSDPDESNASVVPNDADRPCPGVSPACQTVTSAAVCGNIPGSESPAPVASSASVVQKDADRTRKKK